MRKGLIELSLPNLRGLASELHAVCGWKAALANAARAAGPPLLFGLRLWASVCLALYVAFWLQLENVSWAGTSAALGASRSLARRCAREGFA